MADAKNTVLFPYETLKKIEHGAFQKFGFSEKEADIIQDVLLTSDLFGYSKPWYATYGSLPQRYH